MRRTTSRAEERGSTTKKFASRSYDLVMTETHLADMSSRDITRIVRARGPKPVVWMTTSDRVADGNIAEGPESPSCTLILPLTLRTLRKALDDIVAAVATSP